MSDEETESEAPSWAWDLVHRDEGGATSVLVSQRNATSTGPTTTFVASTDDEDRAMDVVKQDWRLRNWRSNPVILDNHNPMRVVGRGVSAVVPRAGDDAGKLMIEVAWDTESPDPSIRAVGHQHLTGTRKAGSVGFQSAKKTARNKLPTDSPYYREPIEVETWWGTMEKAGTLYEGNELLEFSSATIPMNPAALQRSLGAEVERAAWDLAEVLQRPEQLEALRRALDLETWLLGQLRSSAEVRRILRAHELAAVSVPEPALSISFASRVARYLESP